MAISIVMPALEMAQETGRLVAWLKKEGDSITKGDLLLEIETDKAVLEVEAAADGILSGVVGQAGTDIPVGQTIAWILEPGEDVPVKKGGGVPVTSAPVEAKSRLEGVSPQLGISAASVSPKARRLAQEA